MPEQSDEATEKLVESVEALRASEVKPLVDSRLKEFRELGGKPSNEIYKELCFCTLTANYDAERSIAIQEKVCDAFLYMNPKRLEARLRELGYRYPNRAFYIEESRRFKDSLKEIIRSFSTEAEAREWLAKNVKGLGFKEASHFLRNIGFQDLAIVDFHILDLLARHRLIKKPKSMTRKKYLEAELVLSEIAEGLGMSLAELDLYLWYLETGKVLK